MASTTPDVSRILGEYMLQGWTLTDVNCSRADCIGCPLMRSKTGSEFCARCDGGPIQNSQSRVEVSPSASQHTMSSCTSAASHSRVSTPTTPPLAREGLDVEDGDETEGMVPIAPPGILAARRVQSDLASARIGELLLRGWALLNGQCEGPDCWAIPLMRSPKNTPASDASMKRKWCVICEHDWGAPQPQAKRERVDVDRSVKTVQEDVAPCCSSTTFPAPPEHAAQPFSPTPLNEHLCPDPKVLFAAQKAIESAVGFMTAHLQSITEQPRPERHDVLTATEALGKVLDIYRRC